MPIGFSSPYWMKLAIRQNNKMTFLNEDKTVHDLGLTNGSELQALNRTRSGESI